MSMGADCERRRRRHGRGKEASCLSRRVEMVEVAMVVAKGVVEKVAMMVEEAKGVETMEAVRVAEVTVAETVAVVTVVAKGVAN